MWHIYWCFLCIECTNWNWKQTRKIVQQMSTLEWIAEYWMGVFWPILTGLNSIEFNCKYRIGYKKYWVWEYHCRVLKRTAIIMNTKRLENLKIFPINEYSFETHSFFISRETGFAILHNLKSCILTELKRSVSLT